MPNTFPIMLLLTYGYSVVILLVGRMCYSVLVLLSDMRHSISVGFRGNYN